MRKAVNLRNNGESGRVLEFNLNGKRVVTPSRAVNHVERKHVDAYITKYGQNLTTSIIPPCEIQETVFDFNNISVNKLSDRNGEYSRIIQRINTENRSRQSRIKIINIRMAEGTLWNRNVIEILTRAQVESGKLDAVSIPDPIYNRSSEFNVFDAYNKARDYLDQHGLSDVRIIPNLDMKTEPADIEARINEFLNMGVDALAFRFRPRAYPSTLRVTQLLSDKDVWIHLSGVRKEMVDGTVPAIQIQPLYSFDSISSFKHHSPRTKRESGGDGKLAVASSPRLSPDDTDYPSVVEIRAPRRGLTRFDGSVLGIFNRQEHRKILGSDLNCTCVVCRGINTDSFFNYGRKDGNVSKPVYEIHHTVHELWASQNEFIKSRQIILESGYNDYLLQKTNIVAHENCIFGLVPRDNLLPFLE